MPMEILVPFHAWTIETHDHVVHAAGGVGAQLGAALHGLALLPRFPRTIDGIAAHALGVDAMAEGIRTRSRERGVAFGAALEAAGRAAGLPSRLSEAECFPAAAGGIAAEAGRYHDLILIEIGTENPSEAVGTAEACVFGAGRPVLVTPPVADSAALDRIMIAWDGSRVAARAVSDAAPFLARATAVSIAVVEGEKPLALGLGERLAAHLGRHGIDAEVGAVAARGRSVAEALQDRAAETGAGLLVMGAFGHSRLRDFVLGGATAAILKGPRLPTLLSH